MLRGTCIGILFRSHWRDSLWLSERFGMSQNGSLQNETQNARDFYPDCMNCCLYQFKHGWKVLKGQISLTQGIALEIWLAAPLPEVLCVEMSLLWATVFSFSSSLSLKFWWGSKDIIGVKEVVSFKYKIEIMLLSITGKFKAFKFWERQFSILYLWFHESSVIVDMI